MPFNLRPVSVLASIALGAVLLPAANAQQTPYLHAPSVTTYAKHDPNGTTILPTGRLLKPVGKYIPLARWPHGLALSPDGKTAFVASEGVGQFIENWNGDTPVVKTFTLLDKMGQKHPNAGGAVFAPDGKTLYWSGGDNGQILCINVATREITSTISLNGDLNGQAFADSYASDVKRSEDGAFLYAADLTNFRVVVIDASQRKVVGSASVGRYPYALAVQGQRVYVANIGMFEYSAIPALPPKTSENDRDPVGIDKRGLTFPAFGFPSKEARDGVDVEERHVAGLGDPNVAESFSVWGVSVEDATHPAVFARIKTGLLVGAPSDKGKTVGGSAPNFLAVRGNALYVSNGNNDSIERIDLTTGKIVQRTRILPSPLVSKLRGVGPSGLALSPDGNTLYVAESGLNAVGVLDTRTGKMKGHVPVGWYPYRVALSPDGSKLMCLNFRGFGNGPKGIKNLPDSPFLALRGMANVFAVPTSAELPALTRNVLAYNGIVDSSGDRATMASPVVPTTPGTASAQIKYVVFLTKENHTYDTIFDHIKGANDDPSLLRWGYHQTIAAPGQPTLNNVAVMTNHNALARQFTVSDNFYMEPEASGVGHRWLVGVQPDNFCQMTYTLGWNFKVNSTAPGRRASFGSNGSLAPEDYPEAGAMWEHLASHKIGFRNYGEGFEFAGVLEDENESKTGAREVVNIPMSKVLFDNTCREFPIFNMNIPDQYRAFWFEQDFTKHFLSGSPAALSPDPHKGVKAHLAESKAQKTEMPPFVNIAICNDHGDDPKPAKGYPYVASWMADNDLALGRIVEFLSHTPYWKHMAIFVTQDDAGGEPDHIDAQRSVLLCISPYARHGYVSHRHTTIVSMHRTLYEILGLPPLNMFDALANDFSDCFTDKPDFTPYTARSVDPRIFDPEKAKDPKDPDYVGARKLPSVLRDDEEVEEKVLKEGAQP